jgi:hypothetical protein
MTLRRRGAMGGAMKDAALRSWPEATGAAGTPQRVVQPVPAAQASL